MLLAKRPIRSRWPDRLVRAPGPNWADKPHVRHGADHIQSQTQSRATNKQNYESHSCTSGAAAHPI